MDPAAQATATATTRAGILAVLAATIAAIGATVALYETRRANLAADQRERYTSAISQLGDDKLDVRLGGLYGLERIAHDSPRDRPTVIEVLCAFVRGHGQGPDDDSDEALEKHRPPTDVQAALTVIGRVHEPRDESDMLELVEAHLERAQLQHANLTNAILINAHMTSAYLRRARLSRAELFDADLKGANLSHAFLDGAWLRQADLAHAELDNANLSDAHLTLARLSDASLTSARLRGAGMARTDLRSADLYNADLRDAWLGGADLRGANLTAANLTRANLHGADLTGARGLTQEQLNGTGGDQHTRLPESLTRPERWLGSGADRDTASRDSDEHSG